MNHKALSPNKNEKVTTLFTSAFTASEGDKEGKLIGKLASGLSSYFDDQDIICFGTYENESLIGSIFFTRLRFSASIQVYLLAPVAVRTEHQQRSEGQALINFGLKQIENRSANVTVTYGDPTYYSKVGFRPLSETVIKAPLDLSMPEGWLGQALMGNRIPTLNGRPTCVMEFDDPAYW
jgi:predicted N-acetyltransferase YhbS